MRQGLCFSVGLALLACGGGSSKDTTDGNGAPSDGMAASRDGALAADAALAGLLEPCRRDSDCASGLCSGFDGGYCTWLCTSEWDCPLATSWECWASERGPICACAATSAEGGCDADCDGVDLDDSGLWKHSVQSGLRLLISPTETEEDALDLNDDGHKDNAFGSLVAVMQLSSTWEGEVRALNAQAVAEGGILQLHSLHADDLSDDRCASWRTYLAQPKPNPDFSGAGAFTIDGAAPATATLYGSIVDGVFRGGFGAAPLRLIIGETEGADITLSLRGVRVEATVAPDGCVSGSLGGGIPIEEVDALVPPVIASELNLYLTRNPTGDTADNIRDFFDEDGDGIVSLEEVRTNAFVGPQLQPSLDVVGADGALGHDGVKDSMSIGVRFDCVPASYAAPDET